VYGGVWRSGEGVSRRLKRLEERELVRKLSEPAKNLQEVADDLLSESRYFSKNKRRMRYLSLREEGYVIGSRMVESGCKKFKERFCGPGMRWSKGGIERLIPRESSDYG
jgi:hypothetical protein